jgi:NADPH-dependent 2,4-dienoyl-CoA reductase/sulfur reductase-like enzyme
VETTLAVTSSFPLSQVVDREAGRMALAELKKEGVEVRGGHAPAEILLENGYAAGVRFSEPETSIPCCLVIAAKGMKPRSELLSGFGFDVSKGIPVDSNLMTPLKDVYAAGDVTLCRDIPSGEARNTALWPVAVDQGRVAGLNMAGAGETYEGSFARNSFRIGELHFVSAGMVKPMGDNSFAFSEHLKGGDYRRALAHEGRVGGFVSVARERGQPGPAGIMVNAVGAGMETGELPSSPLEESFSYADFVFQRKKD